MELIKIVNKKDKDPFFGITWIEGEPALEARNTTSSTYPHPDFRDVWAEIKKWLVLAGLGFMVDDLAGGSFDDLASMPFVSRRIEATTLKEVQAKELLDGYKIVAKTTLGGNGLGVAMNTTLSVPLNDVSPVHEEVRSNIEELWNRLAEEAEMFISGKKNGGYQLEIETKEQVEQVGETADDDDLPL